MARSQRPTWRHLYNIYGVEERGAVSSLLLQGLALGISAGLLLWQFTPCALFLARSFPLLPLEVWSLVAGFVGGLTLLMSVCFLVVAANTFYGCLVLRSKIAQRMVGMADWSGVSLALDVGCGSGILLNTIASQLKKERGGGRVVGVDLWTDSNSSPETMTSTLRNAALEGVQEYVTCKSGDPRDLPFFDTQFDLVMSSLCFHKLGKHDSIYAASAPPPVSSVAASERWKGLLEVVRVLKPGGQAIIWDLVHVPEYACKLRELHMQGIHVSETIPAFMMPSHIVSFQKPL